MSSSTIPATATVTFIAREQLLAEAAIEPAKVHTGPVG